MSTDAAPADDLPELTEHDRWEREVLASSNVSYQWGTHEFTGHYQYFGEDEDGRTLGHLEVAAPGDPPPCADLIVKDALEAGGIAASIGRVLADGWGIDVDEVLDR